MTGFGPSQGRRSTAAGRLYLQAWQQRHQPLPPPLAAFLAEPGGSLVGDFCKLMAWLLWLRQHGTGPWRTYADLLPQVRWLGRRLGCCCLCPLQLHQPDDIGQQSTSLHLTWRCSAGCKCWRQRSGGPQPTSTYPTVTYPAPTDTPTHPPTHPPSHPHTHPFRRNPLPCPCPFRKRRCQRCRARAWKRRRASTHASWQASMTGGGDRVARVAAARGSRQADGVGGSIQAGCKLVGSNWQ